MIGLIVRKEGMSRLFNDEGKSIPVTILKVHSNIISQIKLMKKRWLSSYTSLSYR